MKKSIEFIALLIFLFVGSTIIFAQGYGVTTVKAGYFNPKDAKGGFIIGGTIGSTIDEKVDVGIGLDFFRGSNKKETKVGSSATGGITEEGWIPDSSSSITLIPITALLTIKIPASHDLFYTAGIGGGYGFLWAKEKKYKNGDVSKSKTKFYHGFHWILSAGILYKLGSRSSLIIDAFYDGSKLNREEDNITYKVNPSGLGVRVGIRFGIHR